MKTNRQKSNWILDAILFTGFLVSFALDWTGLSLHQWIGIFSGLLAVYHLAIHWDWVTAVTLRFFGKTSGQARSYYLLDVLILLGFYLILLTGLVISTWFDLPLTNYAGVKDFHVVTSIVTLCLVVLKIGLHGHWITRVARQHFFRRSARPVPAIKPVPVTVPVPARGEMTRADFLKLMSIVGVASLMAFSFTVNNSQDAQVSSADATTDNAGEPPTGSTRAAATQETYSSTTGTSPTTTSEASTTTETTVTAAPTTSTQSVTAYQPSSSQTTTTCFVRCDKRCSYPGHCRRYQDINGNNRCDLGECM